MKIIQRSVSSRAGSEGPRHDPYGYTEIRIDIRYSDRESHIIIHMGLAEWIEIDDGENCRRVEPYDMGQIGFWKFVDEVIGVPLASIQKYIDRREAPPKRCPDCQGKLVEGQGFVGEGVLYCEKCGKIVWSQDVTLAMIQ